MSRAYRISVQQTLRRTLRASDHVQTQLEILEILPPEQMAQLLSEELERRGFHKNGKTLTRHEKSIVIEVEPEAGTVTVRAEAEQQTELEGSRSIIGDTDTGRGLTNKARKAARNEILKDLEKQASGQTAKLQQKVTEQLEGQLADLRKELDQVVNRVTAEALKRKAAQIGQIKELTEDPENGSMTIVVEV